MRAAAPRGVRGVVVPGACYDAAPPMLRTSVAILALLVVLAGVGAAVWIYPHIAMPSEPEAIIAERWARVGEWAAPAPGFDGPRDRLSQAIESLERSELRRYSPRDRAITDDADLDADARAALDHLVAWAAEGGGLGDARCVGGLAPQALPGLPLMTLAELAVRSADGPDAPRVGAALRLGAALRGRGDALLGVVGFRIAERAQEVARERTWPIGQAFVEHRPRREQVFPIVARESLCSATAVEAMVREGEPPSVGEGPLGLVTMDRELAVLRWYEGRRLAAAEPHRGDLSALLRALAEPPEPPKSLLLPVLAVPPTFVGDAERTIAAYDVFLAGGGR